MSRLITITATTKVSHDEDVDSVGQELARALVLSFKRSAAFGTDADDYGAEVRIDHYIVGRPPQYLPAREARVTVTAEVRL